MARALSRLLSNPIFTQNLTFFLYRANTMHQTTPNAEIEDFGLFWRSYAPNYTIARCADSGLLLTTGGLLLAVADRSRIAR